MSESSHDGDEPSLDELRRPLAISLSAWQAETPAPAASDMVKIKFEGKEPAVEYPKDVLQLRQVRALLLTGGETTKELFNSSVLRDALDTPQPTNQPGKAIEISLPDPLDIGIVLLNILWSQLRPSEKKAEMVDSYLRDTRRLIALADKYNVSALLHTAYTVLIVQAYEQGLFSVDEDHTADGALSYAAHCKDPWLCHYVVSRLSFGDPADWNRGDLDDLGMEFWAALVCAYPRSDLSDKSQHTWARTAAKVPWKELCQKLASANT